MTTTPILDRVILFSGLAPTEQKAIATCLRRRWYSKDELVFHQNDDGEELYIVETGSVNIDLMDADGKQIRLATRQPGDFFGEMALVDGGQRSATATAAQHKTQLLELAKPDLLNLLRARPEIAMRMMVVLSQRLREDSAIVGDTAFLDVQGRLARVIIRLADANGVHHHDGQVIETQLTQSDLAAAVGATREAVNRALATFGRLGLVKYRRGQITILQRDKLAARIH